MIAFLRIHQYDCQPFGIPIPTDGLARGSPARLSHELPLPPVRADPFENPHPQRQQRGHHPDEGHAALGPQKKTHRRAGSQGSRLCKCFEGVFGNSRRVCPSLPCGFPSGPALPLLPSGSDPGASSSEPGGEKGPGQDAGSEADFREQAVLIRVQRFHRLWQVPAAAAAAASPSATSSNPSTSE